MGQKSPFNILNIAPVAVMKRFNAAAPTSITHLVQKGCAVHKGIRNVSCEQSWCRLNLGFHKPHTPFLFPSCGRN